MHWSNGYVGLPFKDKGRNREGVDCWGVVALAYAEQRGIALPSYTEAYASAEERGEIDALVKKAEAGWPWRRVEAVQAFDIAVFRRGGLDTHVGIVLESGVMLHVEEGRESAVVRFDAPPWRNRLVAVYRHAEMIG